MKILALDSSATVATVAVCDDGALLAEYTLNNGNTHSETLLPMVECVLGKLSMTVNDIDIFAASSGPGSFTGDVQPPARTARCSKNRSPRRSRTCYLGRDISTYASRTQREIQELH